MGPAAAERPLSSALASPARVLNGGSGGWRLSPPRAGDGGMLRERPAAPRGDYAVQIPPPPPRSALPCPPPAPRGERSQPGPGGAGRWELLTAGPPRSDPGRSARGWRPPAELPAAALRLSASRERRARGAASSCTSDFILFSGES